MTREERQTIIEEAKFLGATSVVIEGIEYKFSTETKPKPQLTEIDLSESYKDLSNLENYTEEELLYWSTPYFDELQAQKEKQAQAAKERE